MPEAFFRFLLWPKRIKQLKKFVYQQKRANKTVGVLSLYEAASHAGDRLGCEEHVNLGTEVGGFVKHCQVPQDGILSQ